MHVFVQIYVSPSHIDWKDIPEPLVEPEPHILNTAEVIQLDPRQIRDIPGKAEIQMSRVNNERITMHTGNLHQHMEVRIIKGPNKSNLGVVRGSHFASEGVMLMDVLTTTMANNTFSTYPIQDVRERLCVFRPHEQCAG